MGEEILQVGTSETIKCAGFDSCHLQFNLCVLVYLRLHMTLKRRAEISADIFARLLRYFRLSCKNLTIMNLKSQEKNCNFKAHTTIAVSVSLKPPNTMVNNVIKCST